MDRENKLLIPLHSVCFSENYVFKAQKTTLILSIDRISFESDRLPESINPSTILEIPFSDINELRISEQNSLLSISLEDLFYVHSFRFMKGVSHQMLFNKIVWFCLNVDESDHSKIIDSLINIIHGKITYSTISHQLFNEFQSIMFIPDQINIEHVDFISDWSNYLKNFSEVVNLTTLNDDIVKSLKRKRGESESIEEERKNVCSSELRDIECLKQDTSINVSCIKEKELSEKVVYRLSEVNHIDLECLRLVRSGKRNKDESSLIDDEDGQRTVKSKRLRKESIGENEKEQERTSRNKRLKKFEKKGEMSEKVVYHSSEVSLIDLECLRSGTDLNDNIIHFYMTYVYHEILNDEQRDRSHLFSCFFITKLMGGCENKIEPFERHKRVAKWTKNIDIFEKDYLIFPVIENQYWFLVIVCFPWMVGVINYAELLSKKNNTQNILTDIPDNQSEFATTIRKEKIEKIKLENKSEPMPCILIFDSYNKPRVTKVNMIREYLKCEWDTRRSRQDGPLVFDKNTIRGFSPQVPQQKNTYDSGLFMLHYVEEFFKHPFKDFSLEFFQTNLTRWFKISEIKEKRDHIISVILNCKR